jgi:hypothetical protein
MSKYKTVYKEIEFDIELTDFDTDDLIEELTNRGELVGQRGKQLLTAIWLKRRQGKDYQRELDHLIYESLGHIV